MAKAKAKVEKLVWMIERGELCLPEMQRRYVWRSTRVCDLLDSLESCGCPLMSSYPSTLLHTESVHFFISRFSV